MGDASYQAAQRANPVKAQGKRGTSAALGSHSHHDRALKGRSKAWRGLDTTSVLIIGPKTASCVGSPLQGFTLLFDVTQGVALGWYGVGPLGRLKARGMHHPGRDTIPAPYCLASLRFPYSNTPTLHHSIPHAALTMLPSRRLDSH